MTHQNILRTRLDSQHTFQIVVYDPVTSFQSLTEMPADRIRGGYTGAMWVDQMDVFIRAWLAGNCAVQTDWHGSRYFPELG